MTNTDKTRQSATTSNYENSIAIMSILGISGYLVLRYALDTGHESYTLNVNAALTSAIAHLYLFPCRFAAGFSQTGEILHGASY